MQLLSVVARFSVTWPDMVQDILGAADVLSFNADVIQPQCSQPGWSFDHNLYIQLAMPAAIGVIMCVWTGMTYILYR